MALTYTRRELVERALSILGKSVPGQAPASADVDLVDDLFDGVVNDLLMREIAYIDDEDEIPAAIAHQVAFVLALAAFPDFGGGTEEEAILQGRANQAEDRLRLLIRDRPRYTPLEVEAF